MGSEWKPIGEMLSSIIDYRGKTPPKSESGIPCISAANVKNGRIDISSPSYVSQETYDNWTTRGFPKPGDVVITTEAPVGEIALFPGDQTYLLTRRVMALQTNQELLDNRYLIYSLHTPAIRDQLFAVARGTTVQRVLKTDITGLKIPVPPLPEQKRIAHILGSLDDKIELNRKMNATLEAMAQALFKSWFVDFDPVIDNALRAGNPIPPALQAKAELRRLNADFNNSSFTTHHSSFPSAFTESEELGWIPEGWEASTFGEAVTIVGGGTPSTKNSDFWDEGTHYWTTPKDFSSLTTKIMLDSSRKVTDAGLAKISSGLLPINSVLMSSRAPIGYMAINKVETAINQGFIGMICDQGISAEYMIYCTESRMDDIKGAASGSTFAEISKKTFKTLPMLKPHQEAVVIFTQLIQANHNKIHNVLEATSSLTKLRDTLLPKLISGELRLPEVEHLTH